MTVTEMLAREILRLDARGGRDTEQQPDHDPDAWPTEEAVRAALMVTEGVAAIDGRWPMGRAA